MKLNNKGMSIIEIVISFTLVMIMVTGMLTIVVNYRNKAALSIEKLEMNTFKNTLTQDIQNDILTLGIEEINSDGECPTLTGLDNCINLVFDDGSERAFGVSKVSANDRDSIEKKYLYYDGIKYKLHEVLPEVIPEGRNMVDLQSIVVENKNFLTTDSAILEDGTTVTIYSIDVYISHIDFQEDFGIHIVATTDNAELIGDSKYLRLDILDNNKIVTATPTLTAAFNKTSDTSGLYKSAATNSGKPTYYFRGDINNNYVSFADFTWRIVRINEDGTIRLIMEDGIDNNTKYNYSEYVLNVTTPSISDMYYSGSLAEAKLATWYSNNITNKGYSNNVATGNYFCEQAKVATASNLTSSTDATMTVYSSYNPNFKCSPDGNDYGLVNSSIGLINYDELVFAGDYPYNYQGNTHYLYSNTSGFWTMSPASYNTNSTPITSSIWVGNLPGSVGEFYIAWSMNSYLIKPVINLKADTIVTGNGTELEPYVVQ